MRRTLREKHRTVQRRRFSARRPDDDRLGRSLAVRATERLQTGGDGERHFPLRARERQPGSQSSRREVTGFVRTLTRRAGMPFHLDRREYATKPQQ